MIPREFFETASSHDRQFIRRWTLGVSVLYSILAVAIVALSFVLHAPNDTTAARDTQQIHQAILVN
jgi:uncharacterized membrane protein